MVFSSLTFLQCFLPLCLLAYFLVPQKWRNGTLFLFSLLFYAWGEPVYVVLMLFSTGISFNTFQTMSYTIDVYRGEAKAQKNIINFGAYVTLFPQLIAGPIVRYQTVADELEHRDCTADLFAEGVKRFACGITSVFCGRQHPRRLLPRC